MTDRNAIRDAIAAIADTAHPPQRIRAAVDARYGFHRRRRLVLRTTGAAAVAAVGGLGIYRWSGRPGFPSVVGGPGGGWLQAEPRWRPTWLPGGLGLTTVGAIVDGGTAVVASRSWTGPEQPNQRTIPFVGLTTGWSDAYASRSVTGEPRAVDVHGTPGQVRTVEDNDNVWLTWQPAGEPRLTLSISLPGAGTDEMDAVALRVAKSLRRDPDAIAVGPHPGWLPPEFAAKPWMFHVTAVDEAWLQSVSVSSGTDELNIRMGPRVERSWNTEGSLPVRVRGVDALVGASNSNWLLVPFPDGFQVAVTTNRPGVDLAPVVEDFDFGPVPDMTWYGSR